MKVHHVCLAVGAALCMTAAGAIYTETFDSVGHPAGYSDDAVPATGQPATGIYSGAYPWVFANLSVLPWVCWFEGDPEIFPAHSGASNSYIGVNYQAGTGDATRISSWLLSPVLTFENGNAVSLWTRTVPGSDWPDSLQIRLSISGESTNVGTAATSVGVFTTLLTNINPLLQVNGYPTNWTQYLMTISGLASPTQGRIGLRYYVNDNVAEADYIGVDDFMLLPEPLAWLSAAALAILAARRRRS